MILIPLTRLVEAALRSIFMAGYYEGFWDGLTKDLWFSRGWLSYVQTPLGLTMTLLPALLICGAMGCFCLAIRAARMRSIRQQNKPALDNP